MNKDYNQNRIFIELGEDKDSDFDKNKNTRRLLSFSLGKDNYCVDIKEVNEVIILPNITQVPNTPSFVIGVINLRGDILPIIDICNFLNTTSNEEVDNQKALIVDVYEGAGKIGILVSDVKKTLDIDENDIQPTLLTIDGKISKHIKGQVQLDTGIQVLLSLQKLFESDEIKSLRQGTLI